MDGRKWYYASSSFLNINYKTSPLWWPVNSENYFKSQSTVKIEFDYEIYNEQRELLTIASSILVLWIWKQVVRPFLQIMCLKRFWKCKKKYLFFDFYVYFNIELKMRKFRHFFRFYLILPIGNPVSSWISISWVTISNFFLWLFAWLYSCFYNQMKLDIGYQSFFLWFQLSSVCCAVVL
jgi:hypothetical protein